MRKLIMLLMGFALACPAWAQDEPNPQTMSDADRAKVAQELNLNLDEIQYVSNPISDDEKKAAEAEVKQAMQRLDTLATKTDESLNRMVKLASWVLKRKGYNTEAEQLQTQYAELYSHAVFNYAMDIYPVDLGDHAPLSQWLADWYNKLEAKLSPEIMRYTKLEDIKILNYSIPVVFHPKGYNGDSWDMVEYRNHFAGTRTKFFYPMSEHDGIIGVIGYWSVWAVCVGATWGAGAITFICSPIAEVSDFAIEKYVAPPVSDWIFCKATSNGPGCPQQ